MSALILGAIWWVYHVPLIIVGWYGDVAHLPAFTVAIIGIALFIGVITDRSRSLWPSVLTHGAWNALVATSFAATEGIDQVPAFSGSDALLGEFGWLAAAARWSSAWSRDSGTRGRCRVRPRRARTDRRAGGG